MEMVPACLIEKNSLLREGLKSLLAETHYRITETHADIDLAGKKSAEQDNIKLVIWSADDSIEDPSLLLSDIRKLYSQSRVVILSSHSDLEFISAAFSAGADGFLARDILPVTLLSSLNMVMAGEKICPALVPTMFSAQSSRLERSESIIAGNLSQRETQILKHLANGETNKQIANTHNIAEATVKVHVKTILRKLSLANRTQAAIWAISKGLTHTPLGNNRMVL